MLTELIGAQAADGDRLTDVEIVTLVWHLVLAGQTPTNLIANAVDTLLAHPDQLATLRADDGLMPGAVEELTRWCGPQLLTFPRLRAARTSSWPACRSRKGEPVTAALAAANRDPRVFADPDRLDLRPAGGAAATSGTPTARTSASARALARVQTEVALTDTAAPLPRPSPAGLGRADARPGHVAPVDPAGHDPGLGRVGVALDDRHVEREADRGLAEQQAPGLGRARLHRLGHRLGLLLRAVHDHLVVHEEDQLGLGALERGPQRRQQDQRPLGRGGLDDEVAGEPAPRPAGGAALGVSAEPTSSGGSRPASRQAVEAGGQVRPSQERTRPPASPVRAAASTYSNAVG